MIKRLDIPKECEVCDGQFMVGGPMWSGDIHNQTFVQNLLTLTKNSNKNFRTSKRIKGILEGILVES